jgi:hypothetical protein
MDLEAQLQLASLKELRPIVERASVDMETIRDHLMILSDVWKAVSIVSVPYPSFIYRTWGSRLNSAHHAG